MVRNRSLTAQQRDDAGPPSAASRLKEMLANTVAQVLVAPLLGLIGGFMLLFGGIFLAVAWATCAQPLIDSQRYAPMTAHTSGHIVDSWAAIEFDPADVPRDKLYWHTVSRISPCLVVEYSAGRSGALRRAFCGNRFTFREDFRLDDWSTMAPGVPFAFLRDASGFAVEEIRMSKAAFDWIATHPPRDTFLLSKPAPTTALGALREQFDRPLDVAASSWSTPLPAFALAYDPQHPEAAMPAPLVEERRRGFWWGSAIFTLILAAPGLMVWRLGWHFLSGQTGAILWLLTLAPLLGMPWWSELLPQILAHANKNWAEIGRDMLDDINRVSRFSAAEPDQALLAHGERLVWHVDAGAYADTFGQMHFHLPTPAPASPEAALAALRNQASARMRTLDSAARAAIFRRLRQQYDAFARNVQSVFTSAAEDTLRDADADAAAHRAARDFLVYAGGGAYYEDQLDAIEATPRSN